MKKSFSVEDANNNNVKPIKNLPKHENKSCIQQRYILAAMAFFGLCNTTFLRNNVSVAILSMVNATHPNSTHTGDINWSNAEEGVFLGAFFYGYAVGNLPGAWIVSRYGFRNSYGISSTICAVLTLLTPASARFSFYLATAQRIIIGLVQGICVPATVCMWSKWAPAYEKTFLVSISFSGYLGGFIILFPTASAVMELISWEAVFYITGGSALLWSALFFLLVAETPQQCKRISSKERDYIIKSIGACEINRIPLPWKSMLKAKSSWGLFCGHFSDAWFQLCLPIVLPTFLVDVLNFNILESGLIMTLPFILQWLVVITSGKPTDILREKGWVTTTRLRKFNTCFPLVIGGLLTAGTGYIENNPTLVVVFFTSALAISGLTYSGYLSNPLDIAPRHSSMLMGVSNAIATSSGFIGPSVAAVVIKDKTDRSQWQTFFWITCAISLFGAIMFGLLASGVEQKWAKAEYKEENRPLSSKVEAEV